MMDALECSHDSPRRTPRRTVAMNYGFTGDAIDLDDCTAAIRRGSKSFHIASLLLPRGTRQAAHALYAFCRHSDDVIDDPARRPDALHRLRQRLDRIYAGAPCDHACDRAFARIVQNYAIPKTIPLSLLDGFAMDMAGRQYQTIAAVKEYAARVAATVGLMMSLVMRAGDGWTLARAADLGLAMQLTNIARDVGEDARQGRLYLPLDWLREAGIDGDTFLRDPHFTPALGGVVKRLLDEADRHYRLGHAGIAQLPGNCRHAIRTAALTYQDIGRSIARNGYDTISRRARTSLPRKLSLVLRAVRPVELSLEGVGTAPPDPAVSELVAAAAEAFALVEGQRRALARSGSPLERVALIMIEIQQRQRDDQRQQRLARWQKVARLV
ncbi:MULTISPECIES: phytoene/squalene synthase family protein [unclassified Azospirillum]|uniref:phytoene/squalene synthase family protein n=1 Tax=unclassified Azospirillum TaxID=2630922 RepID=UPI000B6AF06E|nr:MULTISPECIES: phytoene/squalene synthase family protein [unclassified Azospirillum]SNT01977.1 phytoene synthase [Azospirillum sp. RU38E]SNT17755.1 phytoene synthase [Azospirillum sp. RU37A]